MSAACPGTSFFLAALIEPGSHRPLQPHQLRLGAAPGIPLGCLLLSLHGGAKDLGQYSCRLPQSCATGTHQVQPRVPSWALSAVFVTHRTQYLIVDAVATLPIIPCQLKHLCLLQINALVNR